MIKYKNFLIPRRDECRCQPQGQEGKGSILFCWSCWTLSAAIMRIVFDLPEGFWYRVISLEGDRGYQVFTCEEPDEPVQELDKALDPVDEADFTMEAE